WLSALLHMCRDSLALNSGRRLVFSRNSDPSPLHISHSELLSALALALPFHLLPFLRCNLVSFGVSSYRAVSSCIPTELLRFPASAFRT
ncbi:hypothetical protein JI435_416910, partial [Parastagonospora nodorum SN15]